MPETKLKNIFPLFPEDMHNILVQVATGHTSYLRFAKEQNENLLVPMEKGQKPFGPALLACSDSRMGKWIVGRKSETAQVLEYRCVGAILTKPVNINSPEPPVLKDDVIETLELASHYRNDIIQCGHDSCGANGVFYTYHMVANGKQKIWDEFGPAFAKKAEQHAYLVEAVNRRINKDGLRYYKDLGFNLGDDAEGFTKDLYRFTLAMSIEQTEFNRKALSSVKEVYDNNPSIKNKLGIIGSVLVMLAGEEEKLFLYSPKEGRYFPVPSLDHSLVRKMEATLKHSCHPKAGPF